MTRAFNFAAGPATIPQPVLERSAQALVDYQGKGVGIAEVSHRGAMFAGVITEAEARIRRLMGIGDDYAVLFLQGGATQQFELIPMNYLRGTADFIVTGNWAKKAAGAAKRYGTANVAASSEDVKYDHIPAPDTWQLTDGADYLHICSNNTCFGTRFSEIPRHPCLVADMSSEILSRRVRVEDFGLIFAGAQKNLGPSGVVLVIVRKELLERAKPDLPKIFDYAEHAAAGSCINTPPTFGIYVLMETFGWIEEQGGVDAIEARNEAKAKLLYDAIDAGDFYTGTVEDIPNRSRMNVTFTLPDEELTKRFIAEAEAENMLALKGYRTVGGIRASIYNGMPEEGCRKLAEFMRDFAAKNG